MLIKRRPNWISERFWQRLMLHRDRRKYLRRQLFRLAKNPKLAFAYSAYRKAVESADWPLARERVKVASDLALQSGDRTAMIEMAKALERVDCYSDSSRLWLAHFAHEPKAIPNEWRGEDLTNKTVLINLDPAFPNRQGLGTGYLCAHLIPEVTARAKRVAVLVEPRLAMTFQRTFPELEIFGSAGQLEERTFDFVALPRFLMATFMLKDEPPQTFHALFADPQKAATLRSAYRKAQGKNAGKPMVGFCWHSIHHGKDSPDLSHWREFIERTDATFVSLQYGNVAEHLDVLGRKKIIVDDTIDQMKNMDDFAAQVAALDGVISIVNTLVNVAGAMNVPTVVLRDDWFRRNWPVLSDRTPWYPSVRVAGRNGRDWGTVLDEAYIKLEGLINERPLRQ